MNKDKWTKRFKIIVIILMILAYTSLATVLLTDFGDDSSFPPIFYLWIIGGLLYAMTIVYAVRTEPKTWTLLTIIISGTVWLFPPLMFTFFGIPFLIAYLWTIGQMIYKNTRLTNETPANTVFK